MCQPDTAQLQDVHIHDNVRGAPWSCVSTLGQGSKRKTLGAELVPMGHS